MEKKPGNSILKKIANSNIGQNVSSKAGELAGKAKIAAQKAKRAVKAFAKTLAKSVGILASPNTWLVMLLVVIVVFVMSFFKVFGPINIQEMCTNEGIPILDELKDDQKEGAFVAYFTERGISKEAAIYVASIADITSSNFGESKGIPDSCDNDCIEEILKDDSKLEQVEIGPYRIKGEYAKTLLTQALEDKSDWRRPERQLPIILNMLNNASAKPGSEIKDPDKGSNVKLIDELSDLFGVNLSGKDLSVASNNINKKKNNLNEITCVSMGTGKGRGRMDGGSATDTSGGPLADFAGLDMSNLVNFMNSFVTTTRVKAPIIGYDSNNNPIYGYGPEKADPKYIAAKEIAEQNGGKDPGGAIYASCDRFVATTLKAQNIDTNFKWGNAAAQIDYMKAHKCWQEVDASKPQDGDVVGWYANPGSKCGPHGHIAIYAEGNLYEASYKDAYPAKSRATNRLTKSDGCGRIPHLFRWNKSTPGCEKTVGAHKSGSSPSGGN